MRLPLHCLFTLQRINGTTFLMFRHQGAIQIGLDQDRLVMFIDFLLKQKELMDS